MIGPAEVVGRLAAHGVTFHTGVPDSLLKPYCTHLLRQLPRERHVIAANEGAAVGLAIGHYLRTGAPAAVYLQNSGFGNIVNPVLSLADPDVYGVPMVLIIGWRGQPGVADEPQHVAQGRLMTGLLDAMELPWQQLPAEPDAARAAVDRAVEAAVTRGGPAVLLVAKGTFADAEPAAGSASPPAAPAAGPAEPGSGADRAPLPSREDAVTALADAVGGQAAIVATTGMLSRELFEHRTRTGQPGDRDFLTVGGMGHASSIALGVALREPDREVWCFDGDGALLMHLGSLAVIAEQAPPRYRHVIVNNGVHDSVGGQPTAAGVVDIPALARAAGYRYAEACHDVAELPAAVARLRAVAGPALLELRVRPGHRGDLGRPTRTPAESRQAFMAALAQPPETR